MTDHLEQLRASLWPASLWIGAALLLILFSGVVLPGCSADKSTPAMAAPTEGRQTQAEQETAVALQRRLEPEAGATQRETPVAGTPSPRRFFFPFVINLQPWRTYLPFVGDDRPTPTPTKTPGPTSTPAPTPTPTPPWPEPLEEPGRSKLGLHVQWNNSPDIMEFIRRAKPAVVKAAGDLGFLAEVKEVSPSTVTVGRLAQGPQKMEGDPVQAARNFVAKNLEQYQLNPAVDYWEGYNEPGIRGRMEWYAAFEAERVRVMASHGFRTAVGTFSTGVPEWEEFGLFLPAIEAAYRHGGILALHEYDAPTLGRSIGAGLPGRPSHPDRGALALRYRWWYEDFLKPAGLVVPLVISEAGVDGGITNRPGPEGRGWKDFRGYWAAQGLGDDSVRVYIDQLARYDAEVQQDNYVIGFTVFTAGAMSEEWESYDITGILRQLAVYVVSQR